MKTKLTLGIGILVLIVAAVFFVVPHKTATPTNGTIKDTATEKNKQKPGTPKLTPEENKLKQKYESSFQEINQVADKKIDSLLDQAKKEVDYQKQNHIDTKRIPQKYMAILDSYDTQAKTQFDALYKQLESEAKKSKLSATTFGQVWQAQFQAKKLERSTKFKKELQQLLS